VELGERAGKPSYLVDDASHLRREWFHPASVVGLTAGASAPEVLVRQVVDQLRRWGAELPAELAGREEHVVFSLPKALRKAQSN
jgi:4-hydroxy-3-methylbut-2-enyl diphosphate reductase